MQPGDHVGIFATNCIEWVEAMFAVYKIRGQRRERELPLRRRGAALPLRQLRHGRARVPARVRAARSPPPATRSRSCSTSSASSGTAPTPTTRRSSRSSSRRRSPPHSPERDFGERSDDDIYLLYTGGTTGMPKGVMWRQEDVYFALGGGIDVFTRERVHVARARRATRSTPSQPSGLIMMPIPPLMHGAGQIAIFRVHLRRRHRGDHRQVRRRGGVAHSSSSERVNVDRRSPATRWRARSPTRSRRCDDERRPVVASSRSAAPPRSSRRP